MQTYRAASDSAPQTPDGIWIFKICSSTSDIWRDMDNCIRIFFLGVESVLQPRNLTLRLCRLELRWTMSHPSLKKRLEHLWRGLPYARGPNNLA